MVMHCCGGDGINGVNDDVLDDAADVHVVDGWFVRGSLKVMWL